MARENTVPRSPTLRPASQKPDSGQQRDIRRIRSHSTSHDYVIGVDIGGSNLRIALADMQGTMLGKWTASTKKTSSPQVVVRQIYQGVKNLRQQLSLPSSSLLAVAAGAPGVTDRDAGVVHATSYLKGWKNVRLGRLLESALHVPAVVENDVRLGAVAENWRGSARGLSNFVFLAIGTGIAAGIFVNGQLLHGVDWVAGEVGYMIVPGTPETPAGEGMPGSLESVIGGEGIEQQWQRLCQTRRTPSLQNLPATKIFELALSGNRIAQDILDRSARILSYALYNLCLVLNCSLLVLGGTVGLSKPLLDATTRILERYPEPVRPKLVLSCLGPDAQLMGAIRLALDKAKFRIDRTL